MSETERESSEAPASVEESEQANVIGKITLVVAAILMAIPATIPLLVLFSPGMVPFIEPVDTSDTGMVGFLIGFSLVLLLANWGFLYAIHRWLNKYAPR